MSILTCRECGALVEEGDLYCGRCGSSLGPEGDETGAAAMTQKSMDVTDIRYKLGMVYYRKGSILQALEIWKRVLLQNPENESLRKLVEKTEIELRSSGGEK